MAECVRLRWVIESGDIAVVFYCKGFNEECE